MGRKLDALFGRKKYDTGKIKANLNLGISRLAVLKNQRQARCNINNSDVLQLLNLGQHERALLRVDQVIKDQNMLDAYVIIEGYLHQLIERISLVWSAKVCPEDVNEAAAGLIYASVRCGEFPELQEIRSLFASRFGKEFTARAMELRNNCGVSYKIIQKLSPKMPSLESRMKVLKAMASENNITLQLEDVESEMMGAGSGSFQPVPRTPSHSGDVGNFEGSSDSVKRRTKYKDVAAAAQAAFESAAHAAAAAQAAVELSRTDSRDPDDSSIRRKTRGADVEEEEQKAEKFHSMKMNDEYESEEEEIVKAEQFEQGKNDREFKRTFSSSSSESSDNVVYQVDTGSHNELMRKLEQKVIVFDESDDEESHAIRRTRNQDLSEEDEYNMQGKKVLGSEKSYHIEEDVAEQIDRKPRHFPLSSNSEVNKKKAPEVRPASVRTKRTQGR